jgi:uncharacterized protein with GYD domain
MSMPRYVALFKFTDQGRRNIPQLGSLDQARSRMQFLERAGVKPLTYVWTDGRYDVVAIVETETEDQTIGPLLRVAMEGNMTFELARAYNVEEIADVLGQMGPIAHVTPQGGPDGPPPA